MTLLSLPVAPATHIGSPDVAGTKSSENLRFFGGAAVAVAQVLGDGQEVGAAAQALSLRVQAADLTGCRLRFTLECIRRLHPF
ncbi:UNVERIFIED_CONTAM: hypothetical protein RKD50_008868 [Streptomyces canus]